MRAYLSVPSVSSAALTSGADALVITGPAGDLRGRLEAFGTAATGPELFVQVGPLGSGTEAELAAAMPFAPAAILLPADHGRDIAHLGARLAVHEAEGGLPDGHTRIVALIRSAAGLLAAASFSGASPRLRGLAWDRRALGQALGVIEPDGMLEPLMQSRGLVRLAAAAAGVEAIDAGYPTDDENGFARHLAAARRDGFAAVLTTSPEQVALLRRSDQTGTARR